MGSGGREIIEVAKEGVGRGVSTSRTSWRARVVVRSRCEGAVEGRDPVEDI